MLIASSTGHQANLFCNLAAQLDPNDPLLRLASAIPWQELDQAFAKRYCQSLGRPAKRFG
jgi:transposase, IS5 family